VGTPTIKINLLMLPVSVGHFPKQESPGAGAIGWSESDIQAWLDWLSEESSREVAGQSTGTQSLGAVVLVSCR